VLYTTLSPCYMCAGSAALYEIPRVVIGENENFQISEDWLRSLGVQVDVADDPDCIGLMRRMISERSDIWLEDIGETARATRHAKTRWPPLLIPTIRSRRFPGMPGTR